MQYTKHPSHFKYTYLSIFFHFIVHFILIRIHHPIKTVFPSFILYFLRHYYQTKKKLLRY